MQQRQRAMRISRIIPAPSSLHYRHCRYHCRYSSTTATWELSHQKIFVPLYNHKNIEPKWQRYWEEYNTYKAERHEGKEKKYILDMFPYPSGSGLHVGHVKGYTATDVMARYWRLRDYDVLHPIGWDAFGLPAEQHAINTGTHPAVTTYQNIANFKKQLKSLGFSYDWDREFATTDVEYVKWTQWIFLQLFKRGLAFQAESIVNWCPALGTVLANEEVVNGLSERGNHPVIRSPLRQWALRISKYGDRLDQDLEGLQWPKGTIAEQHAWIGKSEGAFIRFPVVGLDDLSVEVFTTRPETIMGVTFLVLAPEHSIVDKLITKENQETVERYRKSISGKKDLERMAGDHLGKSGVALGCHAIHPITKEQLPIYIADHILYNVGTGAVMGVPCHNSIDHTFATHFQLPMKRVIQPPAERETADDTPYCQSDAGTLINSSNLFNGMSIQDGRRTILEYLEKNGIGRFTISYFRNREWTFSRQRYWGEPIPIYYPVEIHGPNPSNGSMSPIEDAPHTICYDQPIPLDESELPLTLPEMDDFHPRGEPHGCLSRAKQWKYFQRDGKWFARETNTMPQWAGSCWYYLRFADPKNSTQLISKKAYDSWLPVDLYIGGQEHAVLHLLYARFWHKVLFDIGVVKDAEPFKKLIHQGMILGPDGEKMSKSRGNVISIDEAIEEYGADILRMYEMFGCPLEHANTWSPSDIIGMQRFFNRFYYLLKKGIYTNSFLKKPFSLKTNEERQFEYELHLAVRKITQDMEKLSFPIILEQLNQLINFFYRSNQIVFKDIYEILILIIAPFAPHVAEECWELIGNHQYYENLYGKGHGSVFSQHAAHILHRWPSYSEEFIEKYEKESKPIVIGIALNGKKIPSLSFSFLPQEYEPFQKDQESLVEWVRQRKEIEELLQGKDIAKTMLIDLKGERFVNFAIKKEKKEKKPC